MVREGNDHDLMVGVVHNYAERELAQHQALESRSTGLPTDWRKGNDVFFDQIQH